ETPSISEYFPAVAPVPTNFNSTASDALLNVFDPNTDDISPALVQKSNKKPRYNKDKYLKDLREAARDAWSSVLGLEDPNKLNPSWKKIFEKTKYKGGHVYEIVGWPDDIALPKSKRNGKLEYAIDGLTTADAKRVLEGFRKGDIKFEKCTTTGKRPRK
ncbi:hypothetical protein MBANPS3_012620, partial [Mucor bainieri]